MSKPEVKFPKPRAKRSNGGRPSRSTGTNGQGSSPVPPSEPAWKGVVLLVLSIVAIIGFFYYSTVGGLRNGPPEKLSIAAFKKAVEDAAQVTDRHLEHAKKIAKDLEQKK